MKKIIQIFNNTRIPKSLLFIDLDNFKLVNDSYGHLAGDYILAELAKVIRLDVRKGDDFIFRWGGEEFVIILTNSTKEEALVIAERLRRRVEEQIYIYDTNQIKVTVSIGVSSTTQTSAIAIDKLIDMADNALYKAKQTKNLVALFAEI